MPLDFHFAGRLFFSSRTESFYNIRNPRCKEFKSLSMKIGYLRIRSNWPTPFRISSFEEMSSGYWQQDNVEESFSIFIGHYCPTVMKKLKAKRFCKILGHSCPIFLKRSFVLMPADLCTLNAINDSLGGSTL